MFYHSINYKLEQYPAIIGYPVFTVCVLAGMTNPLDKLDVLKSNSIVRLSNAHSHLTY